MTTTDATSLQDTLNGLSAFKLKMNPIKPKPFTGMAIKTGLPVDIDSPAPVATTTLAVNEVIPEVQPMPDVRLDPALDEFSAVLNDLIEDVGVDHLDSLSGLLGDLHSAVDEPAANAAPPPVTTKPDHSTTGTNRPAAVQTSSVNHDDSHSSVPGNPTAPGRITPVDMGGGMGGGSGFSINFGRNPSKMAKAAESLIKNNGDAITEKAQSDEGFRGKLQKLGDLAQRLADMIPSEEIAEKFKEIAKAISDAIASVISKLTGHQSPA